MKKIRIKEEIVDGVSSFYPQFQGLFKRWKYFEDYHPYCSRIICFDSFRKANEFVEKILHEPVVIVKIHEMR